MAKAIKLNIKNDFNFVLIGLVTSEPIYRLSWLINQELGLKLADYEPMLVMHTKSKTVQSFIRFAAENELGCSCELINNKCSNGILIEEQKHINYYIKITDCEACAVDIVEKLKSIKNISLATSIEPGSLKSINRFISTVETD